MLTHAPASVRADNVKTTVRKVPYPAVPEPMRPKKITLDSAFHRWTVKIVWDKQHGSEDSVEARLVTSDVIAGIHTLTRVLKGPPAKEEPPISSIPRRTEMKSRRTSLWDGFSRPPLYKRPSVEHLGRNAPYPTTGRL